MPSADVTVEEQEPAPRRSWGFFHEHGGLDRVRCVFPRQVGVRTDLKSTIDYLGNSNSMLQRLTTGIAEHRVFPAYQLLAARRAATERRMSRFAVVSEASPYSRAGRVRS